ncbi:hypothetical protein [Niveibacterium sp. SC-1]|uniref:hypothetical protein n=1 Tax=Niveibacterium sp. SC-1 TaxID=3135646 RepID=UPI00311F205A
MYKVQAESLEEYFASDPARRSDLEAFDAAVRRNAPGLERWFHPGVKAGEPGMQFKMIGYGVTECRALAGTRWPLIGVALQKNYIAVYLAIAKPDPSLVTEDYRGKLGESRMGQNNLSFETFGQRDHEAIAALLKAVTELTAP